MFVPQRRQHGLVADQGVVQPANVNRRALDEPFEVGRDPLAQLVIGVRVEAIGVVALVEHGEVFHRHARALKALELEPEGGAIHDLAHGISAWLLEWWVPPPSPAKMILPKAERKDDVRSLCIRRAFVEFIMDLHCVSRFRGLA